MGSVMRFAVDMWSPEYGSATEDGAPVPSLEDVDLDAEVPEAHWGPRSPGPGTDVPGVVCFVDGVRRIDARVWVDGDPTADGGGPPRQGICATWAAGVVRCERVAELASAEVRRGLFCPLAKVEPIATRHGRYAPNPVASDDPDALSLALQASMADLEQRVSEAAGAGAGGDCELLVLDGPLRQRHRLPGAVGFVKTHHRVYLSDSVVGVIGALADGQRTPVFLVGGRWSRWSWYLRLPGERTHGWAGIVRCEASLDVPSTAVPALADRVTATLPRFASAPHKDARAPQNLYPIAGLERQLRRRLGDPSLMLRCLRSAASASVWEGGRSD